MAGHMCLLFIFFCLQVSAQTSEGSLPLTADCVSRLLF